MKKLILFDIDYTLFDAALYRDKWLELLADKIGFDNTEQFAHIANEIYFDIRKSKNFDPTIFSERLVKHLNLQIHPQELEDIILNDETIRSCLYDEVEDVFRQLSTIPLVIIGIFSGGRDDLQRKKINKIDQFFHKDFIHIIRQDKEKELESILQRYSNYEILIVDDMLPVLYTAKLLNKNVITVWSMRGRWAKNQKPITDFRPDYSIENLREIVEIIKK